MDPRNSSETGRSDYRPALTGAEWHVLLTVLGIARDTGLQLKWTAEILQDFEFLLRRRSTGEQRTPSHQDLLNVAEWRQKIFEHRYRTPAILHDRTVIESVSVHLTSAELDRLIWVCGEVGRNGAARKPGTPASRPGNLHLQAAVTELCSVLQERPRISTRKALKQSMSTAPSPAVRARAEVTRLAIPVQRSLRKVADAAADVARRHGLR